MIQSTFVLLRGIGPSTERRLWGTGITHWDRFLRSPCVPGLSLERKAQYDELLGEARAHLSARRSRYFTTCLKARDHWRLFEAFRADALYLDIETTGGPPDAGDVTVVGLYRPGSAVRPGRMTSLVLGETLTAERLQAELSSAHLLVTFFGSVFDLPYLRAKFPSLVIDQPHFDLCFAARRLGLQGGLKQIEARAGIAREADLRGLDGWDAVRLWREWRRGDPAARDRLLRYNESDTRNLEALSDTLYEGLAARYGPTADDTPPWSIERA